MTQTDVEELFVVLTPFAIPDKMAELYAIALKRFNIDAPGCNDESSETLAVIYYIAGMLSSGASSFGVKSEKIDDYSITFIEGKNGSGPIDSYLSLYQGIVDTCNASGMGVSAAGPINRQDRLECLDLDGTGICGMDHGR